ncbi:MAG: Helicase associated domain protein [Verrucomicrobia bacterium]|nr:Helicase associated domain protein [Verrucomicrobiota bacterium]
MPRAQHAKTPGFVRQGLFAGVTTFQELEARIAALPDEQSRGDAFEVFAEAYLATQRKHDAALVWPLASVPTRILQTLGLAVQDYGVDGVFKTLLGQFNAYQVKFRANRPALTWRELSTFMGLADSPQIRSRVLLTNCDDLPSVLNERQGFFCIRGSDLDRLEADDFRAIEAWLADAAFTAPKKQPQPHQTEALDALLPALETHDRVSGIMACGTGKTLVALWVAEHVARAASPASSGGIPAVRILVLLPSLALVRQTLHEWLHETRLPSLAYLCVCSDPTVTQELDGLATPQSDLDFEVTTDSRSVREFLDAKFTGVKILFATYQSARKIAQAMRKSERFDLGIFDEAHKTAGREGRNVALALEDRNLPIRKRLFLTATPRHYNPLRKDKEGDAQLVFSMDKPEVYGPQAYRLTFAEAARRGIICNYKVIISVITSGMVTNELLARGEVLVNGDAIRARQVANQLALRNAIDKYGVNKVFTFHRTVQSAASFVSDGSEGIATHLGRAVLPRRTDRTKWAAQQRSPTDGFQTFHVNGAMPTALRERVMRGFRECARGIMSNARCLTEGVDVPAVDMVAFISPRHSRVDIVQATGRAMRRASAKTTGYVLAPLYVELAAGETIEQAVTRSNFDEVWDVLQAMQEQDEVLAEIIREMREDRGRTKGFNDTKFSEKVDTLGPLLDLDLLRKSITAACLDRLGAPWDEWFGRLVAFKVQFGHCDVHPLKGQHRRLGNWLAIQRKKFRLGILTADRERKLSEVGATLDPHETWWNDRYARLIEFKNRHGHCNVPFRWQEDSDLGQWLAQQRKRKMLGKLSALRTEKLEELGIVWDKEAAHWEQRFCELVEAARRHGDPNLPLRWGENPSLAKWVHSQRQNHRSGTLSLDRARRLEQLGVIWNPFDAIWEQRVRELEAFKRTHGHCDVPRNVRCAVLGKWLSHQRKYHKCGKLEPSRMARLTKLGVNWDLDQAVWSARIAELTEFKKRFEHCNVSQTSPKYAGLAQWLNAQRRRRRKNTFDPARVRELEELGVDWDPLEATWSQMLARLVQFKEADGHCNPTATTCTDRTLVLWVYSQRQRRQQGKLDGERIRRLDEIGFDWKTSGSSRTAGSSDSR